MKTTANIKQCVRIAAKVPRKIWGPALDQLQMSIILSQKDIWF